MSVTLDPITLLVGALGLYLLSHFLQLKGTDRRLPPGPKGWPIIGNVGKDLPQPGCLEWEHWRKHKDLYGPVSSVTTAGHTLVLLNDINVALELLEKRSARYWARPRMVMANELSGSDIFVSSSSDPSVIRGQRKRMHQQIGTPAALSTFYPQVDMEVRRFLYRTMEKPEGFMEHIGTTVGAVILKIVYGYTIDARGHDPMVDTAVRSSINFGEVTTPGIWLVDNIPALRHIPDWFPGIQFKRKAAEFRRRYKVLRERPFAFVQHQMKVGNFKPSYVSNHLEQAGPNLSLDEIQEIDCSAATVYPAGFDTTAVLLRSFFLAMVLFPEVQNRAQEEIARVVGDRLPTPEDQANLPYVNAMINEVLRWKPVVPTGLVHAATEDDVYDGYTIPKGASVLTNIWSYTHDPTVYSDPMSFKPERFLSTDGHTPERDPHSLVFGFGRRVCPGRALADYTTFLIIARSLAVFRIGKIVRDGKEVEPVVEYGPGLASHPSPFEISIQPRSTHHETLIRSIGADEVWPQSDSAVLREILV